MTISDQMHSLQEQKTERLILSPTMRVEEVGEQIATIYLQSDGTRIRVPKALLDLLFLFEHPATVGTALGAKADNPAVLKAIDNLRQKKFLLSEAESAAPVKKRATTDVPTGLFDCPTRKAAEITDDVVFLGVPYDLGDRQAAGTRHGPAHLRETSLQMLYGLERKTGRPRGWFDADRGCHILKNISLGDCGDIFVEYGEPQNITFSRITQTLTAATANGALPVLLGGDASISLPAIALAQAREKLAVLHISHEKPAHTSPEDGFVTARSLPRHCLALPDVSHYVQISPSIGKDRSFTAHMPGHRICQTSDPKGDGQICLEDIPSEQSIVLCLDIDALASPADTTGFQYRSLHDFILCTGSHRKIAALAITGLNPTQVQWPVMSMIALNLLLTALDSATGRGDRHA